MTHDRSFIVYGFVTARLAVIVAVCLCACASQEPRPPQSSRADSAGIEIVTNVGEDFPVHVTFEQEFALGESAPDEAPFQIWPQGVAAVDSQLLVLDPAMRRVAVFGGKGEYLRSFGRQGDGPGEMSTPTAIVASGVGSVSVYDVRKRGFILFNRDGTPAGFQPLALPYRGGVIRSVGVDLYVPVRQTGAEGTVHALLRVHADDTAAMSHLPATRSNQIQYEGCGLSIALPPLFAPELRWDAAPSYTAISAAEAYSVSVYEGMKLVRLVRRAISARRVTQAMALAEVGEGEEWTWGSGRCVVPPTVVIRERGYASHLPAIGGVALDPIGGMWIKRGSVKGEPVLIDTFTPTGEYLGTLPPGSPWPVLFLTPHRIAAIERDTLDVDRLVVYRINSGAH